METYTITVKSQEKNQSGLPLVRALVPGITPNTANAYPIPLNLTEEQGDMLSRDKDQYEAVLMRGNLRKGQDGNEKTGQYPDHYFYEVAMFEGVANDAVMARANSLPQEPVSAPQSAPRASSAPVNTDTQQSVYMRQTGLNCAANLLSTLAGDFENPEAMYQRTVQLAERFVGYLATGKADGLVDALIQDGATVTAVEEKEPEYGYPAPPNRVNSDAFEEYITKAGWNWDDVNGWLDGLDPVDWVGQEKGRNMRLALRTCRDAAIEAGLEPPLDFRTEVE